jgi:hypothetical protein
MLGLRHYSGLAIDLWQGEIEQFSVDILAHFSSQDENFHPQKEALAEILEKSPILNELDPIAKKYSDSLTVTTGGSLPTKVVLHKKVTSDSEELDYSVVFQTALAFNFRHLAVWPCYRNRTALFSEIQARLAFTALKRCLDQSDIARKSLGRVTIVLPDSATYKAFQNAFFEIFPESV